MYNNRILSKYTKELVIPSEAVSDNTVVEQANATDLQGVQQATYTIFLDTATGDRVFTPELYYSTESDKSDKVKATIQGNLSEAELAAKLTSDGSVDVDIIAYGDADIKRYAHIEVVPSGTTGGGNITAILTDLKRIAPPA